VLLDNELWEGSPYRRLLMKIASALDVPLVDSLDVVRAGRMRIEDTLAAQHVLYGRDSSTGAAVGPGHVSSTPPGAAPPATSTTVVFRVYRGSASVPRAFSIVGADAQLGALAPNTVWMRDDGTGGDERAGDGVWSLTARFAPGRLIFYVYTNSGSGGQWEGLDVPAMRRIQIPASADGRLVYLPIETFGRIYMQGDDWHPDAVGYDLIAHAVAREIAAARKSVVTSP
jgi:hypothetical protein